MGISNTQGIRTESRGHFACGPPRRFLGDLESRHYYHSICGQSQNLSGLQAARLAPNDAGSACLTGDNPVEFFRRAQLPETVYIPLLTDCFVMASFGLRLQVSD